MARVAGVFDNFQGLPLTPHGIAVLDGRKLGRGDRCTGPFTVAIPGSDATRQNALDGAAVKPFDG